MQYTMQYEVVKEKSFSVFCSSVKEKIKEGYVPIGGIAVSDREGWGTTYLQAMVK